jgi:pyridoxamine 5'-phosphate oxidase
MPRTALDGDPFRQFRTWWEAEEVPMVLATEGPAARAVVLERFDERGFCFWTSSESPTGRQLAARPRAALVWLWDGRQARVEGMVERVSDEENERHWHGREGKRQLAAFDQSEPVRDRAELEAKLAEVPEEPERPAFWVGYRVVPERFEFWIEDDDYVHDRFEFTRDRDGSWRIRRLQP